MYKLKFGDEILHAYVQETTDTHVTYTCYAVNTDGTIQKNPSRECETWEAFNRMHLAYLLDKAKFYLTAGGNLLVTTLQQYWFANPNGNFLRLVSHEEMLRLTEILPQIEFQENKPVFDLPVYWQLVCSSEDAVTLYFLRIPARGRAKFLKLETLSGIEEPSGSIVIGADKMFSIPERIDNEYPHEDIILDQIGTECTIEEILQQVPVTGTIEERLIQMGVNPNGYFRKQQK